MASVADSSDSTPVSSPAMELRAEATCETPSLVAVIELTAWSRAVMPAWLELGFG